MVELKACRHKSGFTLFSTLIVIILIVISLFPLLRALSVNVLVAANTETNIVALNLAQSKIEELRSLGYSAITDEAKAAIPNYPAYKSEVVVTQALPDLKNVVGQKDLLFIRGLIQKSPWVLRANLMGTCRNRASK